MNIGTLNWKRDYWCAYDADVGIDDGPCGYGYSEDAAIADLERKLNEPFRPFEPIGNPPDEELPF